MYSCPHVCTSARSKGSTMAHNEAAHVRRRRSPTRNLHASFRGGKMPSGSNRYQSSFSNTHVGCRLGRGSRSFQSQYKHYCTYNDLTRYLYTRIFAQQCGHYPGSSSQGHESLQSSTCPTSTWRESTMTCRPLQHHRSSSLPATSAAFATLKNTETSS